MNNTLDSLVGQADLKDLEDIVKQHVFVNQTLLYVVI